MTKRHVAAKRKKPGTIRSKRAQPSKPKGSASPVSAKDARKGSLHDWLEGIRGLDSAAEIAGSARGACLVTDPAGGPAMCVHVDQATCKAMKGRFVGGPC
jgi:hypothetical protein